MRILKLKNLLKPLKLNESKISSLLGIVVILVAGYLVFNYFKQRGRGETTPPGTSEITVKPEAGKTYTVKEGDNLWKIAEAAYGSGYNWVDIVSENKLAKADLIKTGQNLILPNVIPKFATESKLGETLEIEPTGQELTISEEKYTVVKGDNLWKIAVRAYGDGYKWTEVAKTNKLLNPSIIHPGNILTLPT